MKISPRTAGTQGREAHMRALLAELRELEDKLRAGGGEAKIDKQHREGKLTARERISRLLDPASLSIEIGLLVAHDKYDGQAPAAGVVTCAGKIEGRPSVIVANDATRPRSARPLGAGLVDLRSARVSGPVL